MEAFNIKINANEKELTLTILPIEANAYKIIYNGGILGGINITETDYQFIEPEDLEPGDLPLYEYKQGESVEEPIELTSAIIKEIVAQLRSPD